MRNWAEMLAKGEVSSEEIVGCYLQKIEEQESELNAFISRDREGALAQARAADQRRAAGEALSPWDGIPIAVKDNISTAGLRTTCASRFLKQYIPLFDATVVTRLRRGGLPILGKTNLDEFAMGSTSEYSVFGPTKNPHDCSRIAGGSSGGSAAAVAAGQAPWALGTDTGGSIRQPASFCGVVGLKPSYGRVSRYGVIALAPSLDQVGPLASTVEDAAILFSLLAGSDPRDATSAGAPFFQVPQWNEEILKGLKLGIPKEFYESNLDPEVAEAVRRCLDVLQGLGAVLVPLSLASNEYALETYLTIVTAEASSSLARFDGVRYGSRVQAEDVNALFSKSRGQGFGAEVKRRIIMGSYVLSSQQYGSYFEQARQVRALIKQDLLQAFAAVDLIITPTTPSVAPALGDQRDHMAMFLSDRYTVSANLSGVPALSLPVGEDRLGLPIGLQIMARHNGEELLLQAARCLEQELKRGVQNG